MPEQDTAIFPPRLKRGDLVRVVAPAQSLALISPSVRELASGRLGELGLRVSFGEHAEERDELDSSSAEARVSDLHAALKDPEVTAILTVIGGFNSNQLLDKLDFELFRANPKILCGFSDITALQNAIYAQVGLVTYSGPHYSTFGMELGIGYTVEHFKKCCFNSAPFEVRPSKEWSDDPWYLDQKNRTFLTNEGMHSLLPGKASGRIAGGNLCTFNLLQGTRYMPDLNGAILFLEDDEATNPSELDRDLQSLLHQPSFPGVRGIVFGRFQKKSGITPGTLSKILSSKGLRGIPVLAGADFGHTTPHLSFPIGGSAEIHAGAIPLLKITRH